MWWYLYQVGRLLGAPFYLLAHLNAKRRPLLRARFSPPKISAVRVIWIHTLSVGEVNASLSLLKALKEEFPAYFLVFTVATSSGYDLACQKARGLADLIWPGPLDLPLLASKYISHFHPEAFILVETDLWPGILWELKKSRVPILWANAALSSRACNRLQKIKPLSELLLGPFDFIAAATKGDAERLQKLLPSKEISYFGNLKFEIPPPSEKEVKRLSQEISPFLKRPLLVCGSTHPGEEEMILKAFKDKKVGLLLCPRDPSRALELLELAKKMGLKASLRSKPHTCEVMVVDTLGELRSLYGLGDVAFVGGTLVPVGGHNLLEPLQHGLPVLFGSYLESVSDLAEIILKAGVGFQVKDPFSLFKAFSQALKIKKEKSFSGALKVCQLFENVSTKYVEILKKMLNNQFF